MKSSAKNIKLASVDDLFSTEESRIDERLETMPVIVRNLNDDAAIIIMVDSNLQRENILPSERAFAYKMKLNAVKNQGARNDLTSRQLVGKLETADIVGKESGDSGRQVQRYIRLTHLIPELLSMVDEKKIAFNPAVELSYLKRIIKKVKTIKK